MNVGVVKGRFLEERLYPAVLKDAGTRPEVREEVIRGGGRWWHGWTELLCLYLLRREE